MNAELQNTVLASNRRYEQRLERSEKTTSDCPGTTLMATAPHRARDRGESRDRRSLSESGRNRGAAAGAWGRRPPAKPANENGVTTGSDAAEPVSTVNPNPHPNPENLSSKGKAKATSKPANANNANNEVTTGFGVESTGLEVENPMRISSASACKPFREAIESGLSRGRDATAIWQDLVAENVCKDRHPLRPSDQLPAKRS